MGDLDTSLLDRIERQKELQHQARYEARPVMDGGELSDADRESWQRYLKAQRTAAQAEMELLARAIGLIPTSEGAHA